MMYNGTAKGGQDIYEKQSSDELYSLQRQF